MQDHDKIPHILRAFESPNILRDVFVCTGSGWDGVDFFHSSLYGAMFWICLDLVLFLIILL